MASPPRRLEVGFCKCLSLVAGCELQAAGFRVNTEDARDEVTRKHYLQLRHKNLLLTHKTTEHLFASPAYCHGKPVVNYTLRPKARSGFGACRLLRHWPRRPPACDRFLPGWAGDIAQRLESFWETHSWLTMHRKRWLRRLQGYKGDVHGEDDCHIAKE